MKFIFKNSLESFLIPWGVVLTTSQCDWTTAGESDGYMLKNCRETQLWSDLSYM